MVYSCAVGRNDLPGNGPAVLHMYGYLYRKITWSLIHVVFVISAFFYKRIGMLYSVADQRNDLFVVNSGIAYGGGFKLVVVAVASAAEVDING